jgi:cytochrome c5
VTASAIFRGFANERTLVMRALAAFALSSLVMLAPALAAAQDAAAPPVAPAVPAASDNSGSNLDEMVCKTSPPPTGSRLGGGRECHTQREWNQRQQDSQSALLRSQQTGFNSAARVGGP